MCIYKWDYTINHDENEDQNEKIDLIDTKQHLSNIWSWIHEEVKQHWGWVEKRVAFTKKKPVMQLFLKSCLPAITFF